MVFKKESAVVLKKIPYGDHDLIVTLLTQDGMRLSAFAPHARSSQKRFGGCLDLFNYIQIVYKDLERQNLVRLDSAEIMRPLEGVRSNISKFAVACFFSEVILEFLQEKEQLQLVYEDFISFLLKLEDLKELPLELVPQMELKILERFGFRPLLHHCQECGIEPVLNETYFFDGARGGIFCLSCEQNKQGVSFYSQHSKDTMNSSKRLGTYPLPYSVLKKLLNADKESDRFFGSTESWNPQEVSQVRRALEFFIQYTAGKPLKSLQFLSSILA